MAEAPYDSEDVLQALLAKFPDLLAGPAARVSRIYTITRRTRFETTRDRKRGASHAGDDV